MGVHLHLLLLHLSVTSSASSSVTSSVTSSSTSSVTSSASSSATSSSTSSVISSVISSVSVSSSSICPTCYQMPCVIIQAPSWLRGSAAPSLTNEAKRYRLYRRFWTLLGQLGVWNHPTYLAIKLAKTTGNDCRDVMPDCVIKVSL